MLFYRLIISIAAHLLKR